MAKTANELNATHYNKLVGFDGDWRDMWWNSDYLALLAKRVRLSERRRVLDVGCGVGHWGQRLLPMAHPDATMVGVDREAEFLDKARARAQARGLDHRTTYQHGLAEALPFPDGQFDVVTCQTVLMHTTDAAAVIAEMKRVLAPGGVVLAAEPDNFVNTNAPDGGLHNPTLPQALAMVELQVVCAAGKRALGHGDESVGSKLFALFHQAGLVQVRSWTNDRTAPMLPPYTEPAMALDAQMVRDCDKLMDVLEERARRHWLAGGGAPERFDGLWALRCERYPGARQQVLDHTFTRGGGFTMYVCAGEAPAA